MVANDSIQSQCGEFRTEIKGVGNKVLEFKKLVSSATFPSGVDTGEMLANITLAYRHLEDAAMRVGKVIQAYEGGKSIYDNKDAERAAGVTGGHQIGGGAKIG